MKIRISISLSALLLLTAMTGASIAVSASENTSRHTKHTQATQLQWEDSGFGPKISMVNGDPTKGPHVTYVRFTAGMTTPLHSHTSDYIGIVISGTSMHWEPGKPETKKLLSPGAHWFVPGNVPHVSECLPGMECIMAIYQQAAIDFLPTKE